MGALYERISRNLTWDKLTLKKEKVYLAFVAVIAVLVWLLRAVTAAGQYSRAGGASAGGATKRIVLSGG